MGTTRFVTAEDLLAMGSDAPYELVNGELQEVCAASTRTSMIASRIVSRLLPFVDEGRHGIVTTAGGSDVLSRNPDTVVMPDAAFICGERIPKGHDLDRYFPGGPDLAVEVVSPSQSAGDVQRKVALYAAASVPLVWVVYPKQRAVTVHTLTEPPRTLRRRRHSGRGADPAGFHHRRRRPVPRARFRLDLPRRVP